MYMVPVCVSGRVMFPGMSPVLGGRGQVTTPRWPGSCEWSRTCHFHCWCDIHEALPPSTALSSRGAGTGSQWGAEQSSHPPTDNVLLPQTQTFAVLSPCDQETVCYYDM